MISVNDYNTGFNIDKQTLKRLKNMSGILIDQLNGVPIYFVKKETIDEYETPMCLNRECIKEFVAGFWRDNNEWGFMREDEEKPKNLMSRLEKCLTNCDTIACYVPHGDAICNEPHILVAQERITYRNKNQFEDTLIAVILHELTHSYFSSGTYKGDISSHIIEESLCEAYAFSRFDNVENIFGFMTDQRRPPEYTAFKFWSEISRKTQLIFPMIEWKKKNEIGLMLSIFPDDYQFYFRHFLHAHNLSALAKVILLFS